MAAYWAVIQRLQHPLTFPDHVDHSFRAGQETDRHDPEFVIDIPRNP